MNCKICHRENPEHLMRCLIGSSVSDMFLCNTCVKKLTGGTSLIAMIGNEVIVEDFNMPKIDDEKVNALLKIHCPECGSSLEEIGVTGRMGCENCYVVYSDILASADASIEAKEKRLKETLEKKYDKTGVPKIGKIELLNEKLNRAIKLEDYENASKIRDEINKLKEDGK